MQSAGYDVVQPVGHGLRSIDAGCLGNRHNPFRQKRGDYAAEYRNETAEQIGNPRSEADRGCRLGQRRNNDGRNLHEVETAEIALLQLSLADRNGTGWNGWRSFRKCRKCQR